MRGIVLLLVTTFFGQYFYLNSAVFGVNRKLASNGKESANICYEKLLNISKRSVKLPDYLNNQVSLIWYPKAGDMFSHYELQVEDTIYTAMINVREKAKLKVAKRAARMGKGKGFFSFGLSVTQDELENIKNFIQDPNSLKGSNTCVGGVCEIIRQNTKIKIPFPFNKVPTLNAAYLTLMKTLGYKKIVKVEYFGKSAWKNLVAHEIPTEMMLTGVFASPAIVLTIWVINKKGELTSLFVPVNDEKLNSD